MQIEKGKVITDKDFRTTAKSGKIYAIGDIIKGPMLAHKVGYSTKDCEYDPCALKVF